MRSRSSRELFETDSDLNGEEVMLPREPLQVVFPEGSARNGFAKSGLRRVADCTGLVQGCEEFFQSEDEVHLAAH